MKLILNTRTKILITTIIVVFVLCIIILEHFRGGVISHHLLAREDMPKISNWWGILIVPLVSWVLLSFIQKRNKSSTSNQTLVSKEEIYGFIGAFIFGIIITVLFYNAPEFPGYLLLLTFVLALFLPIYRPEFYLGFILSMTYGFGGIIPVVFGLILIAVYTIEYRYIRKALLYILNKIK